MPCPQWATGNLNRRSKCLMTKGEKIPVRPELLVPGHIEALAMQRLEPVDQCGAVFFLEKVRSSFDGVVWCHADKVAVESSMVEGAEGKAIPNSRFPLCIRVGDDMGSLQQFLMPQPAEGALPPIRLQHPFPEDPLVETYPNLGRGIAASQFLKLIATQLIAA